jgi:hypothetical protein
MKSKCVMFVDYRFLFGDTLSSLRVINELNPETKFKFPDITDILFSAIEILHENLGVDVFIYHGVDESSEVEHLNALNETRGEITILVKTVPDELYSIAMGEHIERASEKYPIVLVVGDDPIYEYPIKKALEEARVKVLRRSNENTTYVEVSSLCRYQKFHYAIGQALGLPIHMI